MIQHHFSLFAQTNGIDIPTDMDKPSKVSTEEETPTHILLDEDKKSKKRSLRKGNQSIPGDHLQVFKAVLGIQARELSNYSGDDERLAFSIGDVLTDVVMNGRDMEEGMIEMFGKKNGQIIYNAIAPNFELFLKPHLACVINQKQKEP